MIEAVIADYLQDKLNIPVSLEDPGASLTEFITIERTGGGDHDQLDDATLAIQAYGESLAKAAALAYSCLKQIKQAKDDIDSIADLTLNSGPYNFTDTTTKRYRYQFIVDLVYYSEE